MHVPGTLSLTEPALTAPPIIKQPQVHVNNVPIKLRADEDGVCGSAGQSIIHSVLP